MNQDVYLLLGSNEGDRAGNLAAAREGIEKTVGKIVRQSSVYRTAAWGVEGQPDFYNQVVEIATDLTPEKLLETILRIEQELGRVRRERWGPRVIDIDLLLYGNRVIDTESLKVPHPGIPHRRFTLVPLAELAPAFIHPVEKKTITVLLEECGDPLEVRMITSSPPKLI